jgi:hypothetical protein
MNEEKPHIFMRKEFWFFFLSSIIIILFVINIFPYLGYADYQYTFHGLYSENGTYTGNTTVTVYLANGTSQTFNVNVTTGYGASFDGSNDYLNVSHDSTLANLANFSVEFWMYPRSYGNGYSRNIVWKGWNGNGSLVIYLHSTTDERIQFSVKNNDGSTANAMSNDITSLNTWYYVVAIYDGSEVRIYVDAEEGYQSQTITGMLSDTNELHIADSSNDFYGYIDEFRFYANRTISEDEITKNYNAGYGRYNPLSQTDLAIWFHLDENNGTSTYDESGNGNNGTLLNGATWVNGQVDDIIVQTYDDVPEGFEWDVSYLTVNRWFIPRGTTAEHFWLFDLDATGDDYLMTVKDYAGIFPAWFETARYINNTKRDIERREVTSSRNQVPMVLVTGATYFVHVRLYDGTIYDFGIFVPGSDEQTFSMTTPTFGSQAQTTYKYITAEATRPNATNIQLVYQDTSTDYDTLNVTFTVEYRNGTEAYESYQNGTNTVIFNWYSADNETDYVVQMYSDHEYFGDVYQTWILDYERTFNSFPDLGFLGTWGGLPTTNIMAIFIGLVIAGTCSFKSRAMAPFLFVTTLAMFTYWGGASFTNQQLVIAFAICFIIGITQLEAS